LSRYAARIHDVKHLLRLLRMEMVVILDHREARLHKVMSRKFQLHAPREVAEAKIDCNCGGLHGNKLVFTICILATHACHSLPFREII
jgi:hypothetical protein